MGEAELRKEWLKCQKSAYYFIYTYCYIYDATARVWIPFALWKEQLEALYKILDNRLVIILKARQLGMTWLCLAYALWLMLFHPAVTVLLFSRREDEATYLLERIRGIYSRLPAWMHVKKIVKSNTEVWQLSNGSIAYGFPTTAGDSYTASLAIVDEADLVPDLDSLMKAVKPTIDGGGQMVLLSRSNKAEPSSTFKNMYRAAKAGMSPWAHIFLPWYVRPGRTPQWYEDQKQDSLGRTGSLDDLYEQYPATDEEALQAKVLDKRIPPHWLEQIFLPIDALYDSIGIPGLRLYKKPHWSRTYVIGMDPAEGNPTSDDSSLHVLDEESGEEVACLAERIQPVPFAEYGVQLSQIYNDAPILVERNNHGHAVIGHIQEFAPGVSLIAGWDGNPGWHTTTRGKALMWTTMADAARDHVVQIHSKETYMQLTSIEGATLKAPKGLHDDEAVSFALATIAKVGGDSQTYSYAYGGEDALQSKRKNSLRKAR